MTIINNTPTGGVWLKLPDWSTKEIQHVELKIPTENEKINAPIFELGKDLTGVDIFGMKISPSDIFIAQMRGTTIASLHDGSLPTSQQREVDMSRMLLDEMYKLMQSDIQSGVLTANSNGIYGEVHTLERLAKAYTIVFNEITDNGSNNRHVNFLDRGFIAIAERIAATSAGRVSHSIDFTNITHKTETHTFQSVGSRLGDYTYDDFRESGRRHGQIFAETFLRNHRNGADTAFSLAMEALANMPQTTSFRNISFNDLMILTANTKGQYNNVFQWNSLNTTGLSDFMNAFINQRQESFNEYYKNFLIDIKA